ncbi:MAG: hypothetical protein AAF632_26370 [Bacteroidota bacterium]
MIYNSGEYTDSLIPHQTPGCVDTQAGPRWLMRDSKAILQSIKALAVPAGKKGDPRKVAMHRLPKVRYSGYKRDQTGSPDDRRLSLIVNIP